MAHLSRLPLLIFALLAALSAVQAAPTSLPSGSRRRQAAVTALSPATISSFKPYTHFASTAYCPPSTTLAWDCGPNCAANPSFVPIASGGDGVLTQFWFVGFDPILDEVIVSHQGTDVDKIIPDLTDADLVLTPLDPKLFPGVGFPVLVHNGFAGTQLRSAPGVLAAVQTAMSRFGTKKVTVVGHSLGAAIALLDVVFLPLHVPNATVRYVGYGLPRVGNEAFADYVDAQSASVTVTHINNKEDPVPIVPPILLGFRHPSGEVHIEASGEWASCPGQDNLSSQCSTGSTNLLKNNEMDHSGPYDGVEMGC